MGAALRHFLTIVLGTTFLACVLGVGVDLITANVAVEYFSVHHPQLVPTTNPWVLAVIWGVAASWWFGAIAGVIVASVNHRRPVRLEPARILKWTTIAVAALWVIMIGILLLVMFVADTIPAEQRPATFESDRRLMAVALAHQFEYILGGVAMVTIAVMTWRSKPRRGVKRDRRNDAPGSTSGPAP